MNGSKIINTEEHLTRLIRTGQDMVHVEHSIFTIQGNRKKLIKCDASTADTVRRFQHIAGHPSDAPSLVAMAKKRTIRNCPFTPRDVTIATKILGPSVHGLKGKGTRKTKEPVQMKARVPILKSIKEHYMEVTIAANVLNVNQIPFFSTIPRGIHYGTIPVLLSMKVNGFESALLGDHILFGASL